MKALRLSEVLLPLISARAGQPWNTAPQTVAALRQLERRVAAARLGGGSPEPHRTQQLFDDIQ